MASADANSNATIILGISIESAQSIAAKLSSLQSRTQRSLADLVKSTPGPFQFSTFQQLRPEISTKVLARRIIGNAFNFLASFAASDPRARGEEVVPLKTFRDWWTKFERRIDADPGFLERVGDEY